MESELLLQLFLTLTPVHFKDDLRLQMEAQRLCLFVVYSTHADQVRAYMEKEREEALCSLKDELVSAQQKKIDELHKIHQCQLQHVTVQETGNRL